MSRIANRQQRQEFWTQTMHDPDVDMSFRLKASELLGKSEADFAERVQEVKADVNNITVNQVSIEERIKLLSEYTK